MSEGSNGAQQKPYEGWAMLELMGHRQRPGYVQEVEMFGGKMLRIDIPTDGGDVTEFYGCSAIYCMTACTEEIARDAAKRYGDPRPVRPVDYRERAALPNYDSEDSNYPPY